MKTEQKQAGNCIPVIKGFVCFINIRNECLLINQHIFHNDAFPFNI